MRGATGSGSESAADSRTAGRATSRGNDRRRAEERHRQSVKTSSGAKRNRPVTIRSPCAVMLGACLFTLSHSGDGVQSCVSCAIIGFGPCGSFGSCEPHWDRLRMLVIAGGLTSPHLK